MSSIPTEPQLSLLGYSKEEQLQLAKCRAKGKKQYLESDAAFSACGTYRYSLLRVWDPSAPRVLFVGLNPSRAGRDNDDHTITRCVNFADSWGYGSLWMGNLFAFIATEPRELPLFNPNALLQSKVGWIQLASADHISLTVGPDNTRSLRAMAKSADLVIACWGNLGTFFFSPSMSVLEKIPLYCLRTTSSGAPAHPARLPNGLKPMTYAPRGGRK